MRYIRKINLFYTSLASAFIFFVWKQITTLLQIDIFQGIELDPHYIVHGTTLLLSIVTILLLTYVLPLLLVVHVVSIPWVRVQSIHIHIPYQVSVISYIKQSINRNRLYCVIRC